MQRRAHTTATTTEQSPPLNTQKNSSAHQAVRKKRSTKKSAFGSYYGTSSEAMIQICLLASLLGILVIYTLLHAFQSSWREPLYSPPTSMKDIGDKTARYAQVRQEYDEQHPDDLVRTRVAVLKLHENTYQSIQNPQYDVYNCPDTPPPHYPFEWNILKILENWPPDDASPKPKVHQGLCVFDFHRDYEKALNYRNAELPFVIRGDPSIHTTVERWNSPGYMEKLMGDVPHRTEYSPNNHFMYWVPPPKQNSNTNFKPHKTNRLRKGKMIQRVEKPDNWTQPTEMMRLRYSDWLRHANTTDDKLGPNQPHWYYRLIGCGTMSNGNCDVDSSEYLFDELPFFQPKQSLYVVEPYRQRGIHCRFGMKGVIAENHFDGSRNFIVLLKGERRYILAHPNQCPHLALYPMEHPSARHSAIDWSDPDLETFPQFAKASANEVVLQAGDAMYLPTNWFHYIISLTLNMQCNTRSGISPETMQYIHDCGF